MQFIAGILSFPNTSMTLFTANAAADLSTAETTICEGAFALLPKKIIPSLANMKRTKRIVKPRNEESGKLSL